MPFWPKKLQNDIIFGQHDVICKTLCKVRKINKKYYKYLSEQFFKKHFGQKDNKGVIFFNFCPNYEKVVKIT